MLQRYMVPCMARSKLVKSEALFYKSVFTLGTSAHLGTMLDSTSYAKEVCLYWLLLLWMIYRLLRTVPRSCRGSRRSCPTFDVKLFGTLSSFLGWQITRTPYGIKANQRRYAQDLLESHGLQLSNTVRIPLPLNADLFRRRIRLIPMPCCYPRRTPSTALLSVVSCI